MLRIILLSFSLSACGSGVHYMNVSSDIPGVASAIGASRQSAMMSRCPHGSTTATVRQGSASVRGITRTQVGITQTC